MNTHYILVIAAIDRESANSALSEINNGSAFDMPLSNKDIITNYVCGWAFEDNKLEEVRVALNKAGVNFMAQKSDIITNNDSRPLKSILIKMDLRRSQEN